MPISEVPVVAQSQRVFKRLFTKYAAPKSWAKQDLRKLIDFIIVGKVIPHTPRDFTRKSLGGQNGSLFT